jgi:hypothetical protein
MAKKNVRTEIVVTCWEDGQRVWRTVDNLEGDVSGSMIVPAIEAAQAELTRDWKTFNHALNTHGKRLSPDERAAIDNAVSAIEGSNRWLATAAIFAALSVLNDHAMGTYFTVPHKRAPAATDEDDD